MKVIIQRVKSASVSIGNEKINEINQGIVLLVGFKSTDTILALDYIVNKILNLRIFDDENGVMNKSIIDIKGSILSISQFTLYANTTKGNRPSYIDALNGNEASKLYQLFNNKLKSFISTKEGIFGSDMMVNINNDGPVTIILEN